MWLTQRKFTPTQNIPLEVCWSPSVHHDDFCHVIFGVKACAEPELGGKAGGLIAGLTQRLADLCPVVDRGCLLQRRLSRCPPNCAVTTQLLAAVSIIAELGLQVWLMNCLADSHCKILAVTTLNYLVNSLCCSSSELKYTNTAAIA